MKTRAELGKNGTFDIQNLGALSKRAMAFFFSGSPRPNAELDLHAGFFQNSSVGPSYVAFRTGDDVQNVKNWVRVNH